MVPIGVRRRHAAWRTDEKPGVAVDPWIVDRPDRLQRCVHLIADGPERSGVLDVEEVGDGRIRAVVRQDAAELGSGRAISGAKTPVPTADPALRRSLCQPVQIVSVRRDVAR